MLSVYFKILEEALFENAFFIESAYIHGENIIVKIAYIYCVIIYIVLFNSKTY